MSDNLSLYERAPVEHPVSIVSIPFELGSDARGLSKTPQYLFENGLEKMLSAIGAKVGSYETIPCPPANGPVGGFPKYLRETADVARQAFASVLELRRRGETVLALCGDHASAIGTIKGTAASGGRIGVIYIDAHPDIHTDETTVSGNTHAMITSAAMGSGTPLLASIGGEAGKVRGEDFLYLGVKDFDEPEFAALRKSRATVVTMLDIALHGLPSSVAAIDALRSRTDSIWISMDIDSVDKKYAPGVAMPCEGGFTRREITSLAHYIGKTCKVGGLDIVEILPKNDVDGKTAGLAIELIARFLGAEYTWYRSYMRPYESMRGRARAKKLPRRSPRAAVPRS